MPEQFLRVKEAAALWGVTAATIRRWVKTGLIEAVPVTPRLWRIPIGTEDRHGVQEQGQGAEEVGTR